MSKRAQKITWGGVAALVAALMLMLFEYGRDDRPRFETPTPEGPTIPLVTYTPTAGAEISPTVAGTAVLGLLPTPTPAPGPGLVGGGSGGLFVSWLPVIGDRRPSVKAGVAASYHEERGLPHMVLGLDRGVWYHTWGAVGGRTPDGYKVSVVWCDAKNGYDYLAGFEAAVDAGYVSEYVLFANEPDRPDQCGAGVVRMARLFLDLVAVCPDCLFVGPMYSTADNGLMVGDWLATVGELCGRPCPALERLAAWSLHIYPRGPKRDDSPGWSNFRPSARVTEFCSIVEGGDCSRPVWVTELGWGVDWWETAGDFEGWVAELEGDERVARYFVYAPWQEPDGRFLPLLDWETGRLTGLGRAFRAGIVW